MIKIKKLKPSVNFDFHISGLVMVTSNFRLGSTDTSGALERRIRILETTRVVSPINRKPLLDIINDEPEGEFAPILGGIFKWAYKGLSVENACSTAIQNNPGQHLLEGLNPLKDWVNEELEPGEGAYVAYVVNPDKEAKRRAAESGGLYPYYYFYCLRLGEKPLGHKYFTEGLKTNVPWNIERVRKNAGAYIKGVQIKPSVLHRGLDFQAPLNEDVFEQVEKGELSREFKYAQFEPVDHKDILNQPYYKDYLKVLKATPLKKSINKAIRSNCPSVDEVLEEFFEDVTNPQPSYKARVKEILSRNLDTVKKQGAIPYNYKIMGTSPRILPVNYGQTINNFKRAFRTKCYEKIPKLVNNYVVVDFDLCSCYNTIVLGLFPEELTTIKRALANKGLWEYLREEFIKSGKGDQFNKDAVKICVYSSFFMGGKKAMVKGILENEAKTLGYSIPKFKDAPCYEEVKLMAESIADYMLESPVIKDYRAVAENLKQKFMDHNLVGPTGHHYFISDDARFNSAYPMFLQSYEFYILSNAFLKVKEKYKDVELIGHYHDGNTALIPRDLKDEVVKYYQECINKLGDDLKLKHPVELEVKKEFL